MSKKIKICLSCLALASFAFAIPNVLGMSGTVKEGQTITVQGSYFGPSGPRIEVFDDFENSSPKVGSWSSIKASYFSTVARSGSRSAELLNSSGNNQRRRVFKSAVQEAYISYCIRVPDGKKFPNTSSPKTFPDASSWKVCWIMDGGKGYMGDDDICLPTWANGGGFRHAGNDNAFQKAFGGNPCEWWNWSGWMRVSVWLMSIKVNTQVLTENIKLRNYNYSGSVFDGDDNANDNNISQWTQINFPGWARGNDGTVCYDDIYITSGPNSQCRVELGDKASYGSCTKLAVCTPTSWNDNQIKATVRLGAFKTGETAFVYVINKHGTASPKPMQVTIGQSMQSDIRVIELRRTNGRVDHWTVGRIDKWNVLGRVVSRNAHAQPHSGASVWFEIDGKAVRRMVK